MNFFVLDSIQLLIGGILAFITAVVSWKMGWLSFDGAFASFGVGLIVFGVGGLSWAIILLVFFVSSSVLSKFFKSKKIDSEKYSAKGSHRDAGQVLANGGLACLFVLLSLFFKFEWWPWVGFSAALAAANADTWATEIGALSKKLPVLITDGREVEKGTSGGISLEGILGSLGGAGVVALAACLLWPQPGGGNAGIFIAIWAAGCLGSVVDSFLGATLQRVNFCPKCQKETEKEPYHTCGTEIEFKRGWKWLNNDGVNFFCTLTAALTAIVLIGGGYLF